MRHMLLTAIKIVLVAAVALGVLIAVGWAFTFKSPRPQRIGITFSDQYARSLGLDWKEAYSAMLADLKPKIVRVVAYWEDIESQKDTFNFDNLDFQIREAEQYGVPVALAIGYRVPRWPECHIPRWILPSDTPRLQSETRDYLASIVKRYKDNPAIAIWQVENEPLFPFFGNCPPADREFLKEEVRLVKTLDPSRKVMTTESGELSLWIGIAGIPDVLGTTLYRVVWNQYFGWWKHFLPPSFYTLRAYLLEKLTQTKETVISELQAEPWATNGIIASGSFDDQARNFSVDMMKSNIAFAKRTGLTDIYLWGAEWWYWRKLNGDPSFWNVAREAMRGP